jgi:adenylate cyclase
VSLLAELKRRNVLRAGALYAAAVWALAQGIAQLTPVVNAPAWVARWFLVAAVIGFPFWIALAWLYQLTPSGLKRESEIAPGDPVAHSTGRKLDFWIIGILAVAVVLLATNTFVLHGDATSVTNAASTQALMAALKKVPEKSVAVLPLTNEGGDPKQQYFADGLSEALISDLTQINGLKVIGKYSSFKFRDSRDSPAQIGAMLGVAHLLQGSVHQQGDRIRVTVDLIRATDGSYVWSHSYDEQLKDVFAIQTQIGHAVASALKIKLLGQALVIDDKPPNGNVEAYKLVLQGFARSRHGTEAGERRARALYQQALQLDPNYAYAWASVAGSSIDLANYLTGDARQQAYAEAHLAADKAQALAPDAPTSHFIRGYLLMEVDNDPVSALAEIKRGHALAPNDATSTDYLAYGLMTVGQLQPAIEMYHKAIVADPLRAGFYANLAVALLGQRQLDAAEQAIRRALILQPDLPGLYARLADVDILRGDAAAAVRDAEKEADPISGPLVRAMARQIGPDHQQADAALHSYIATYGKEYPYNVANLYALRRQADEMFEWLQRACTQGDPQLVRTLLTDPFVLAWQHDPRFAALCKQLGLPLPGQMPPTAVGMAPGNPSPATSNAAAANLSAQ